jgi:S-DNA-T family DNA segregation ATPase FtsK/SpoIIIE
MNEGGRVTFSGRRLAPAIRTLVVSLLGMSLLCLGSLGLHLGGVGGFAAGLGGFLMGGFSWAGFFVPVYLLAGAWILLAPVFRRRSVALLLSSILPFLTLSLLLHILARSESLLPRVLLDSFGMIPSALLLFLLLALETIIILTLPIGSGHAAERNAARVPLALPLAEPAATAPAATAESIELIEEIAYQVAPEVAEPVEELEAAELEAPPAPALKTRAETVIVTPGPEQEELPFPKSGGKPGAYGIPVHDVLKSRGDNEYWIIDEETKRASRILTDALKEFNIDAEVTGIRKGPVITLFEVLPAQGVRVSKIANLSDNIALRLAAPSVRIVTRAVSRCPTGSAPSSRSRR